MKRLLTGIIALFLVFLALVPLAGYWLLTHMEHPLRLEKTQVVEVTPGATMGTLVRQAANRGWLGNERQQQRSLLGARLHAWHDERVHQLQVGEYRLEPGDTLISMLNKMHRGDVIQYSFTLVEGWTFRQLRQQLAEISELKQQTQTLSDQQIMGALGADGVHPEGWFAPDTYFFRKGESDLDLLSRAYQRQQRLLDEAWQQRQSGLPLDSPYEALILASIIERETGIPGERRKIAGVFINRLNSGMRLQTDPTVIYGMGKRYEGRIRRNDLRESTPYNTYVIHGLTPTPIAMPGKASLFAAVSPESTDALFFVARGDGSHHFSKTLEEHNAAVARYQLRRREDYRSTPEPIE